MIANQEKFNKKTFKETIDAKTKQVTIKKDKYLMHFISLKDSNI